MLTTMQPMRADRLTSLLELVDHAGLGVPRTKKQRRKLQSQLVDAWQTPLSHAHGWLITVDTWVYRVSPGRAERLQPVTITLFNAAANGMDSVEQHEQWRMLPLHKCPKLVRTWAKVLLLSASAAHVDAQTRGAT